MEATVTQPLTITKAGRCSIRTRAKATLVRAIAVLAANARGEAYDQVFGSPDVETQLASYPGSERERVLAAGFGRAH